LAAGSWGTSGDVPRRVKDAFTDERFKALWRCPPVLAWLASALGVADPEAKSRAVGLEALPRSFAP